MRIPASAMLALIAVPAPLLAAQDGGLFALDPGLSLWTIIVFILVLFILGKYAWGPILSAVDAREEGIREAIDEAKRAQAEAVALVEEHRAQLADSRRQAQELVAEGRAAGERLRKEVEAKAREEAEQLLDRARREIGREKDRAMEQIRTEAVDLALAAASQVLGERLDASSDRQLVERFLGEIAADTSPEA